MAIGKNLKKGNKNEPQKKKDIKVENKSEQQEEPQKNLAGLRSDEVALDSKGSKPGPEVQTLNKLNQDLEIAQEVEQNSRMLVVFPVGEEEYAFEIAQIKEVVPVPPISPVPQTKSYIRGVANVRGNVIAVVDLARKFGLKEHEKENQINYVIVIKSEEIKVAVVSSQVPETLMVKENQIDSTADVMRKSSNEQNFIKGIIKKDSRMIIFIDVLEMVENEQPVNS